MSKECIMVDTITTKSCTAINQAELVEIDDKDKVVPVINGNVEFVVLEDVTSIPVVKIYNHITKRDMYLSWSPEVEQYLGVPLVMIEELRHSINLLEGSVMRSSEIIDKRNAKIAKLTDDLEAVNLKLSQYINMPIWKLIIHKIARKINVI